MFRCPHDSIIPGTLNVLILKAGQRRVRLATYGGRALGQEVFTLIGGGYQSKQELTTGRTA